MIADLFCLKRVLLISQRPPNIGEKSIDIRVLTVFGYHAHPNPGFEDPKVLLGKIPKINTLVGFEVESELASIPDKRLTSSQYKTIVKWESAK